MLFAQKKINFIYGFLLFICLFPMVSPALALAFGIALSLIGLKHPRAITYTSFALQASIVLMGFGMQLTPVLAASKAGLADTALSVIFVMVCGLILGTLLKVDSKIAMLISAGTAICGGSAIAAVAPVINAKGHQTSFALVVIFMLNALALFLFPFIGHTFNLSQETFGYWAAIAIHDTSSVVGAGAIYGEKALEIATTVKLIRALWIIPVSIALALSQKDKSHGQIRFPWFIGLFCVSIGLAYLFPNLESTFTHLHWLGKRGMVMALFLIGANISIAKARKAGIKSFLLGILLWALIGTVSFLTLTNKLV